MECLTKYERAIADAAEAGKNGIEQSVSKSEQSAGLWRADLLEKTADNAFSAYHKRLESLLSKGYSHEASNQEEITLNVRGKKHIVSEEYKSSSGQVLVTVEYNCKKSKGFWSRVGNFFWELKPDEVSLEAHIMPGIKSSQASAYVPYREPKMTDDDWQPEQFCQDVAKYLYFTIKACADVAIAQGNLTPADIARFHLFESNIVTGTAKMIGTSSLIRDYYEWKEKISRENLGAATIEDLKESGEESLYAFESALRRIQGGIEDEATRIRSELVTKKQTADQAIDGHVQSAVAEIKEAKRVIESSLRQELTDEIIDQRLQDQYAHRKKAFSEPIVYLSERLREIFPDYNPIYNTEDGRVNQLTRNQVAKDLAERIESEKVSLDYCDAARLVEAYARRTKSKIPAKFTGDTMEAIVREVRKISEFLMPDDVDTAVAQIESIQRRLDPEDITETLTPLMKKS